MSLNFTVDRQPRKSSQLVTHLLARFRTRGGDLDALLAEHGVKVDAALVPATPLSLETWLALSGEMAALSGDPLFGFHAACDEASGPFSFIQALTSAASTVKDGLTLLVRHQASTEGWYTFSLEILKDEALLHQRFASGTTGMGQQANEYLLTSMLRTALAATDGRLSTLRVWFAHPTHSHAEEIASYYAPRSIQFGAGENGFALDARLLELPLATANPRLLSEMLVQPDRTFLEAVEEHTRASLQRGKPSAAAVAQSLHISVRTLQRRLVESNTTFQKVVDRVRRTYALVYLRQRRMTLDEIAFALGYTRSSAFERAFKRWTGMTPGAFAANPQTADGQP